MTIQTKTFSELITFTRASSATYFDSAGVLQTATTNAARFDYNPSTLAARGILIEEARTNSIRNNTMQGVVAGTPGTMPTNWVGSGTGGGVTRTIVGSGTVAGINYLDVRVQGTTTTALFFVLMSEVATAIAATNGQVWTHSAYYQLIGGSLTNISAVKQVIAYNDIGGNGIQYGTQIFSPTSADLSTQRVFITTTATNASIAFIQPYVQIEAGTGAAIDITLRIGLPQLELGAFATSVIATTTAAATRAADVATINTLSPWFNESAGTLYVEGLGVSDADARYATSFNDNTTNEFLGIRTLNNLSAVGIDGGVVQWGIAFSYTSLSAFKSAMAYATNDIAFTVGGVSPTTDASATLPTVTKMQIGTAPAFPIWCGYLRRIAYYPRRLTNAELQAITT